MRLLRLGLGLLAALLIGAAALILPLWLPGPAFTAPVTLTVGEGMRFADVANEANRLGLLRTPKLLALCARLTRADRAVKSGDFLIREPLSPIALLRRLAAAPDPVHQVTIPEGYTVVQVLMALEAAGFGSPDSFWTLLRDPAFLAPEQLPTNEVEGYLFPDTYTFSLGTPPDKILRRMLKEFRDATGPTFAERAAKVGLSPHQAITLASMVEEETTMADERRLVAAVFHNRLRRGMPLQSDPTVLYGRPPGDRTITREDLRRPTPYNTYVIATLPPGPIANPGRAAIDAAVDPAPVDYLYFVARGNGSHEFSSTLAQHNAAVNRYQRHGTPAPPPPPRG